MLQFTIDAILHAIFTPGHMQGSLDRLILVSIFMLMVVITVAVATVKNGTWKHQHLRD